MSDVSMFRAPKWLLYPYLFIVWCVINFPRVIRYRTLDYYRNTEKERDYYLKLLREQAAAKAEGTKTKPESEPRTECCGAGHLVDKNTAYHCVDCPRDWAEHIKAAR
jgi:hypothetical protein